MDILISVDKQKHFLGSLQKQKRKRKRFVDGFFDYFLLRDIILDASLFYSGFNNCFRFQTCLII